jgi:adenylate cyclase
MWMRGQSPDPSLSAFLEAYAEGIRRYREREWQRALEAFTAGIALRPDDSPSQLYIERSRLYMQTPPPDSWDGVFVMINK